MADKEADKVLEIAYLKDKIAQLEKTIEDDSLIIHDAYNVLMVIWDLMKEEKAEQAESLFVVLSTALKAILPK